MTAATNLKQNKMPKTKSDISLKQLMDFKLMIPMIPNFIRIGNSHIESPYPIQDFTTEQLQYIGELWTQELIKRADKKRKTK